MPDHVQLPGTAHELTTVETSRTRSLGALSASQRAETIEVTLLLRENPEGPSLPETIEAISALPPGQRRHLTREELAAAHGATPEDIERVSAWAGGAGLSVSGTDPVTRRVKLRGTVAQMEAAFRVGLESFETTPPGGGGTITYRDHRELVSIPSELSGIVEHVSGLSSRPIAKAHHRAAEPERVTATFTPEQLAGIYQFPTVAGGGAGLTLDIGIAELGGRADQSVVSWFTKNNPGVQVVEDAVGGPLPNPDPGGADVEVALDWQVVARALLEAAPKATIRLVLRYGPNTEQGFADLWNSFATDPTYKFTGVSTSWGGAENGWTQGGAQAMDAAAQACLAQGIFHIVASGDDGASDSSTDGKVYADHPASSPNALAAGGTKLTASGGKISAEVVWNEAAHSEGAGGGGVSMYFPVPSYQSANGISEKSLNTGTTGRSEPDMAADADPTTGYVVITGIDSSGNPQSTTVGGTSAVAPLLTAGFTALSAVLGKPLGRLQDPAYALAKAGKGFHDVTKGNNAYPSGTKGYSAGKGFDVPSGWGSPIFSQLTTGFPTAVPTPASEGADVSLRGRGRVPSPAPGAHAGHHRYGHEEGEGQHRREH
ncbi:MAG TPA: S53 family peptidase [Candidatus Binatia bacterium]|nr:S53 family peptidase [Candidatus Binatia bacterium]